MKTAFFWIVWAILSAIILRTFYFGYSEDKLNRLRYSALGLEILTAALFLFPWVPDGRTGFEILLAGHPGVITTAMLVGIALVCFLSSRPQILKSGVVGNSAATVLLFISMVTLIPGTVILTANMIAPIIAVMFMLINIVIGLSLWRQLQLKEQTTA